MDSDDLPLIEISGADDSLLQQQPLDEFTFAFLPLQIHKSQSISSSSPLSLSSISSTKGNTSSQVQGSVSTYSNKENLSCNENKLGVPNLSVEPQKMKRSKKAGGYNLRKSLAWDRAFLTEEGVLNDTELSMISGTVGGIDSLSVIEEHGRDSLPMYSGSASLETLEEGLFKELPSGYPNKRNATSRSLMKRDSINGGCVASVSKSAQKGLPPVHGVKKVACKGEIHSSPVASVSQKRLSNTGTKQISTRNSKIPKIPASKKNPSVPSTATIPSAAGSSSLKSSGTPQPAARRSISSKLSSKTKNASVAAKAILGSVPKSNKPSADVGNIGTNSALRRQSLMSHKAQHATKVSKYSENSSSQGLQSGGPHMVKSSDETSCTTALSHVSSDNAGLNRKNVQVQGIKPSGLRMPSPSLRFFSEAKAPVSNTLSQVNSLQSNLLKSSIPPSRSFEVADQHHDFKPTQLLHRAANVDVKGKAWLCSQKADKCSTSSTVAPKVHANVIREKCNQQATEVRVSVVDKNSEATNSEQFRYDNLDGVEKQYEDQVPFNKVEEKDCENKKSVCSCVESEEASYKATILFLEKRTAGRSMLDESGESCPEVELFETCETNTEVQSRLFEDVEFNSSDTNNEATLESQTISNSYHNNFMLAPDSNQSSSVVDDIRTLVESNSCGLDQTNNQRSMEELNERSLLTSGEPSVKLDEVDSAVPVCMGVVFAGQDNIFSDGVTGICNATSSVAGGSKYKHVDDQRGEVMFDGKSSTMSLLESAEAQDKAIENHDMQQRNSTNSKNYVAKGICAVDLDVEELFSHCASTLPEYLDEVPDEICHMSTSDQGEGQSQFSRHENDEIPDNYASVHGTLNACNNCTEISNGAYAGADKQQVLNNELLVKEMMLQSNEADSIYSEVSHNSSYRISQVNHCMEEVKDQIDLLSCLPKNGNDSTLEATHQEFQSSGMESSDQMALAVANPDPEESLCPDNKPGRSPEEVLMKANLEENIKSDEPGCNSSPREAKMKVSQRFDGLTNESKCNAECMDDEDAITKQRIDDQKGTRPPPNVVPFSDEWLAAIESAGEEILTLKTGAVKHSPPDKSVLEPGPWSPVKRKTNQAIGPFDCTKYTNAQPDNIN